MIRLLTSAAALVLLTTSARGADNAPLDGFVGLFDGRTLTGWKQDGGKPGQFADAVTSWAVDSGTIKYVKDSPGKSGHLWTEKAYTGYELLADWKFNGLGTSGLFLAPAHVKIWDATKPTGWASTGSGSLGYGDAMVKPLKKADKSLGEWNTFRIVVQPPPQPKDPKPGEKKGQKMTGTISVWLNGELVIDKEPRAVRPARIGLQDHGTEVWFKNLYIRELP